VAWDDPLPAPSRSGGFTPGVSAVTPPIAGLLNTSVKLGFINLSHVVGRPRLKRRGLSCGVKIPTLEEVLRELGSRVSYVIELKHGSDLYPGIEGKVINLVRRYGIRAKIVSFDFDALERVRSIDESIEMGLIFIGKPRWFIETARRLRAQWLQAEYRLVNEADVRAVHEAGLKIGVWTVNDADLALRMVKMGVDEVTTDNPSLILKALRGG